MQLVVSANLSAEMAANPGVQFQPLEADPALAHQAAYTEHDDQLALTHAECFRLTRAQATTPVRLALFDMDSTLIPFECIDELAVEAGVGERVAAVTERAMAGELDFVASFRERLGCIAGLDVAAVARINARLTLMDGAAALMAEARARGIKTALVSGGFEPFAGPIAARLGMDEFHSNVLDATDGALTGLAVGHIVDATRKAEILSDMAQSMGLERDQVMAVGDGSNDLKMIALAGKGVAFRAKPAVRKAAPLAVNSLGLDALIWLWRWADAL
ncbi:phosphoserine phosphatase SerB [Litorivicinus lipolyticus]|uniref:Phosphoserine phosphatase n=1 Tax=Litorivicinus lipolyticus TaxID=418701 RepID=A0A5Q2Q8F8_9GAMM|nr:phosphoserine phosphatase SerB [Litorivicinus lipolyticus]QGG79353.1 phosphoserine phosphatase SerB [Litorivicinus lipolyticus]